jgi:two-component system chemotaxis response regulator CheB
MVSSLTQKGAEATIRALEIGAFDYVGKPVFNQNRETIGALKTLLLEKIRAAANANIAQRGATHEAAAPLIAPFHPQGIPDKIIAIGASTGGVEALREVFLRLPANAPPIVVTQHMPEAFTKSFAARLNGLSQVTVSEAVSHARLKAGCAYLAPGNKHLKIIKIGAEFVCKLDDGAPVSGHRPSVDVLFHSVAEAAGARAVGVILTGMGKDGAEGMKHMRERGAYNIGQNKTTCVVYGMPQMAAKAGATHRELSLADIPAAVLKLCEKQGEEA